MSVSLQTLRESNPILFTRLASVAKPQARVPLAQRNEALEGHDQGDQMLCLHEDWDQAMSDQQIPKSADWTTAFLTMIASARNPQPVLALH